MRIGELARRTGISERALRYYEEQQLLRPERRRSGYREYAEGDVRTVRNIRTLLAAGLSTYTIAEVLPCMTDDGDALVPACPELTTVLSQDRDRLTTAIDDLLAARDILDAIIAAGGSETAQTASDPAPAAAPAG
ncbi:MerR family transcriptional regulator [Micromonospora palythoicola]|uniref:MerR family transcriptional regulator n=1 Tax=Micromonospora palythoicola TaxID=3120507 RepID=UPI002FCE5050